MPKMREVALEQKVNQLNAIVSQQADRIAELESLVRSAWKCAHTGVSCSDCRLLAGGCTLQSAMRELGIDVDE